MEFIIPHLISDDLNALDMLLIFAAAAFQGKNKFAIISKKILVFDNEICYEINDQRLANLHFSPTDTSGILTVDFSRAQNGGLLLTVLDGGMLGEIAFPKKLPSLTTRTTTLCGELFYNIDLSQFSIQDYKLLFGICAILWKSQKSRFSNGRI
jgi:hypothetical protein